MPSSTALAPGNLSGLSTLNRLLAARAEGVQQPYAGWETVGQVKLDRLLNGCGKMLPNPTLLLRPIMSGEALTSSRIEGTRAGFGQLMLMERLQELHHIGTVS